MSDVAHSIEDFQTLVDPLRGLPVSLPWKGYGSAIFFELGALAPLDASRPHHDKGEACISVEWDWRVEAGNTVLCGSSNSGPEIESAIRRLQGTTIASLALVGQVPELAVQFSNGHWLRSMAMVTGDPQWSVRLPNGNYVYPSAGRLLVGNGEPHVAEHEQAAFDLAERTTMRWGIPTAEPKRGLCQHCTWFVRIDGPGHLLDYGVCVAAGGPFDGRAVNCNSGCPSFDDRES